MSSPVAAQTSPLRPRKRSSAPASTSADAYRDDNAPLVAVPIHIPMDPGPEGAAHASHLRPNTKTRHKALTIHTSDFASPTSSPGHSPSSRPRPLPRVPIPQSAPSDSASTSFRRLPRTPAISHAEKSFAPSIAPLRPEELPPRKESLHPLRTPGTACSHTTFAEATDRVASPTPPKIAIASAPLCGLIVPDDDNSQPISPATTIASVLIFHRGSESSEDGDSDEEEDEALRRRRWRDTRVHALKSAPPSRTHMNIPTSLSPGAAQVPRESRHWYREEKGQLVEQDYDQVMRSLRML